MATGKRQSRLQAETRRRLRPTLAREGEKVRSARKRRGWTQQRLGNESELSQTTISQMERGDGATLSIAAWQRVGIALDLPLDVRLGRDSREETADAGHLGIQELVLRLGRAAGYGRTFELPTKPSHPQLSTDVGLVDPPNRRLLLIECVNSVGDIEAATRSSDRKAREAEGLAIALGHGQPYTVHVCWVVRSTRRNRELLARYPEIFASRFTGSSRAWVRALVAGGESPPGRGLVWSDLGATRLFDWRRPSKLR
jgi:transcriptional regulator with XRE-family HTH domain